MVAKNNLDLSALDALNPQEKEFALKVLSEYANGSAELLNNLKYADYKEVPVDIITFIKDNRYLGKAWHLSDGKCKLFPFWENKLQELFPDNLFTNYNTFIESGARGLGKAQPLDSLVFTEYGYRQMKDIHTGDRIYGNDGKLHNVIGVFPQGVKPVCKITFSDKTTTLCSDEHLWTVYDNAHTSTQKTPKIVTCKEMYEKGVKLKSGESRYKIPTTKPLEFSHNDTLISPYLMGVLLGDGGFSEHSVGFTTYDKEIYDAVAEEIEQQKYSLHPNSNAADNSSWYFVNDYHVKGAGTPNIYVEYGKTLGLAGKHAWEKFIPDVYLYNDTESRLALLQGLMDTDGEVDPSYQEAYSTTSETLAKQVVFLVQSLGGTAILKKYTNCSYVYKGERKPCRDSYNINIKMPHDLLPCRLSRKLERLNPRRLNPSRYIKNIEYVEPQECQCILLDSKEHLYLTNDLIVTHNSEIAVAITLYLMHRLMCLKDPYLTLNLKPTEQVAFAFMNITLDLAMDIGIVKFQNTVQCSPWFMERGTMSGRKNPQWNPPSFIKIIIGSQSSDVIGQAVYCLDGDTIIKTIDGDFKICDLENKIIKVYNVDSNNNIKVSKDCTVKLTGKFNEEYEIELEDGTILKCTPNHRFKLSDGIYKEARFLTTHDALISIDFDKLINKKLDFNSNEIFDNSIHSAIAENADTNKTDNSMNERLFSSISCPLLRIKSIKQNHFDSPKKYYDVINAYPENNFLVRCNTSYIVSHNCAFFDEISFIRNQDVEIQKTKALDMIDTAIGGMMTRFTNKGKNPTLLVLASSKRSEKSFMEEHIKKKSKTDNMNTLIVDEPVWNVRPASEYSGKRFYVAQGNRFLNSEVLPLDITEEGLNLWRNKGYRILDVPIEYYAKFVEEIDRALCDYAGVSSSDLLTYISGSRLQTVKNESFRNPFTKDIIEVGNAKEDQLQYYNFFDLSAIDPVMKSKPLYIHLDMSVSGDKTGIAGIWIVAKKPGVDGQPASKELHFRLAFSVSIKAPKGHQVSFEKNRQFIYWLKEQGFNIKGVSTDTYQSADMAQQLKAKGYQYSSISVDRVTPSSKVCEPYHYLKNTIYEERIEMYDSTLLTEELLGLEKNSSSGKIDHSPLGINCFTADTKISLTDGREVDIVDLIEEVKQKKLNYVYSYNESLQKIEPKKVTNGWCSGITKKIAQVTLENGEIIECTPEHRFMLYDGSYCQAQNLTTGSYLMSFNRKNYNMRQKVSVNHKVVSVYIIDKEVPVYDITVEDNHNFALSAGVVVHNSKDVADALCGSVWNASQNADQFEFDYGETLDTVLNVSTDKKELQQITVAFEQEIQNLLDPKHTTATSNPQSDNHSDTNADFGMGKAVPLYNSSLSDGIIVW